MPVFDDILLPLLVKERNVDGSQDVKPCFVWIEDTLDARGDRLLDVIFNHVNVKYHDTDIFFVSDRLHSDTVSSTRRIDVSSLHDITVSDLKSRIDRELGGSLHKLESHQERGKFILILDSITPFLFSSQETDLARFLTKHFDRVIAIHHSDCLENPRIKRIFGITIVVRSENVREIVVDISSTQLNVASSVVSERIQFLETDNPRLSAVIPIRAEPFIESLAEKLSITSTFNLELRPGEKSARDELVMPFWKQDQEKEEEEGGGGGVVRIHKKSSENKIYYEPDSGDDWDEEDPDDDLDF